MAQGDYILLSGSFAGTGQSASAPVFGSFNISIWGTPLTGTGTSGSFNGTVALERSLDGGTTWIPVATDGTGTQAIYTTAVAVAGQEPQHAAYRFDCTTYVSGTINYLLTKVAPISGGYVWPV